ncbi:hypothetical protein [Falsibacillus albus]|uniref:hypothetical protein n=1 Tax=Falsibacillus albus TaxID=2478915 RepID=UPI001313FAE9|nr:hypothetical protein [Falsibacillus albus]
MYMDYHLIAKMKIQETEERAKHSWKYYEEQINHRPAAEKALCETEASIIQPACCQV